ncbi:MAG: Methylthiotransferase YqeV [Thermoanaerobacterales bacterium 50_218]|nr:MAG: Methylthiotransferase YqeV [Thermoanaerobacterales bacterium 50_218]
MAPRKIAFFTLGCKVNQQETAALKKLFQDHGYQIVGFNEPADVYVVNTCTVTHIADRKSRQMLRRATSSNPSAIVAAVGCYCQVAAEEVLAIPGVNIVIGTQDRARLLELVEEVARRKQAGEKYPKISIVRTLEEKPVFEELPLPCSGERSRAFLKIEDGCEQFCSYCIIPYARGKVRSLRPELVKERFQQLLAAGYREVVLTGIHTSAYGKDLPGEIDLVGLLKQLLQLQGEFRIRLSSLEPAEITQELLEVIASSPRVCRHLHLPLQSGDDEILKLMHRPYTTEGYRRLFEKVWEMIPGVAVTTDVMVGFPGETEKHFENTYSFIASLPFRGLHVFKYSPRPGTIAAGLPGQISPEEKEERSRRLRNLAKNLEEEFARRFLGHKLVVLAERRIPEGVGCWEGLSDNYLRVVFSLPLGVPKPQGSFVSVYIRGLRNGRLFGEPVFEEH